MSQTSEDRKKSLSEKNFLWLLQKHEASRREWKASK